MKNSDFVVISMVTSCISGLKIGGNSKLQVPSAGLHVIAMTEKPFLSNYGGGDTNSTSTISGSVAITDVLI